MFETEPHNLTLGNSRETLMHLPPPPPPIQDLRVQPRLTWIEGVLTLDIAEKGLSSVSRESFLEIKKFILDAKITTTYCNRFNNNPSLRLSNLSFYLDPDDPTNTNCILTRSDFNTLVIYNGSSDCQYIRLSWLGPRVRILISSPFLELRLGSVLSQIQEATEKALAHIKASKTHVP
jgi:hypothetical protein